MATQVYGEVSCSECDLSSVDTTLYFTKSSTTKSVPLENGKYQTLLYRGTYTVTLACPGNGKVAVSPGTINVGTRPTQNENFTSSCG